jgi:zinc and cadmium transporter
MPSSTASLVTILVAGALMAAIALVGGTVVLLGQRAVGRMLEPVIAFAAGALVGGAMFHMLPHAVAHATDADAAFTWAVVGFTVFLALDLLLEWRHCRRPPSDEDVRPLGPLLLLADGLHNFLGGVAISAVFLVDVRAGWIAWSAAALHEIPQEIGDFGAIVHAGMRPRRALLANFVSGLTFPLGGLTVWALGDAFDVNALVALGAGNFLYIAASDLVPEIKRSERLAGAGIRLAAFVAGAAMLLAVRQIVGP